jgi:hemolysin activation/secretion protein
VTSVTRRLTAALALCPVAMSCAVHAQAPPDLHGRSGPNAAPPPPPAYAVPREMPTRPSPPAGPGPSSGPRTPIQLAEVVIESDGSARNARPTRHWKPAPGAGSDVRLDLRPHEILDAGWARRQFQVNHLIGAPTTADRVVALVLLINQAYAQNGYVNSGLLFTNQDWARNGALLQLRLVVGRIAPLAPKGPAVTVTWSKGHGRGLRRRFVRDRMPSAKRTPLNAIDVERDFRLLAEDPAIRTVNAQLLPGAGPGAATLSMAVDPQPRLDVYASVANNRSPVVGGTRAAVGGSLRNALLSGDVLAAEGGVTEGLLDGTITYSTPFLTPGTRLNFRVSSDSAAVIEPDLKNLNIRSAETDFEGGVSQIVFQQPLTPKPDGSGWLAARSLTLGLSAAEKYSTSSLLGAPFSFTPGEVAGRSDFTVLRASADYVERSERQVIAVSATGSFGLRGTGSDVPGVQRPNPHFEVLLAQLNYARRLTPGGMELRARFAGQWSDSQLYSAEAFAAGGQSTVRGYRENLILADSGALGSLELACPLTLGRSFCVARGADWKTVRLSAFVDGAHMYNHFGPQPTPLNLASVGTSVTWAPSPLLYVRLTYAYALISPALTGPRDLQDRGFAFEVTVHPLSLLSRRP